MPAPIIQFIVVAIVAALFLWAIGQFPTLDGTVVKFIRIAVLLVLSIVLVNVVLLLLFGHGIPYYIGAS